MNFEQLTYEDHSKTFHVHFSSKYHLIQTNIYDVFLDKKQGTHIHSASTLSWKGYTDSIPVQSSSVIDFFFCYDLPRNSRRSITSFRISSTGHSKIYLLHTNGILISLIEQAVQRVFCHYLWYITNTCDTITNVKLPALARPLVRSNLLTNSSVTTPSIALTKTIQQDQKDQV